MTHRIDLWFFLRCVPLLALVQLPPMQAQAQLDTQPPAIESFAFAPDAVDTTAAPQDVTITTRITDDDSGLGTALLRFASPSGTSFISGLITPGDRVSGDAQDGDYEIAVEVPQFVEPGLWTLDLLSASDAAGNTRTFAPTSFGPTTLDVTSTEDTQPPTIESFAFAPDAVDTTASTQIVTVTARITDDLSGVGSALARFTSPSGSISVSGPIPASDRVSGDTLDGIYETEIEIPQFVEPGLWTVDLLNASDAVGNTRAFDPAAFGPTTLDVTSTEDTQPPTIESFAFAPDAVDTTASPQTVTVTARITDDLSGVGSALVRFTSPSGVDFSLAVATSDDRVSGDALDGIYEIEIVISELVEPGLWTVDLLNASDAVGNSESFDAAGFGPATLDVTSLQDTLAPTIESFAFAPDAVDTTASPQTVTVTTRITDDLSGVGSASVRFSSPTAANSAFGLISGANRVSGNTLDGVYEIAIEIPRFVEPGLWTVDLLNASDADGNTQSFDPASFGPTTLDVTATEDTQAPTIESFAFTPDAVDTTAAPQTVTVTTRITDDLTGIGSAMTRFKSPSGKNFALGLISGANRISGDALDGVYEVTIEISRFVEPGLWTVDLLSASDTAGNSQSFDPAAFGAPTLDVTSLQDTQAPTIESFAFSPLAVDTRSAPQTVTVTTRITDDLSGVASAVVRFNSPSGTEFALGLVLGLGGDLVSGDALDGDYRVTVEIAESAEPGLWTVEFLTASDAVGNSQSFDAATFGPNTLSVSTTPDVPALPPAGAGILAAAILAAARRRKFSVS